ncbi:MAG TPA: citrate/2-methylcitrate synthase [Candidatus Limnocylindria bacterium]|nr:citrate/2-methylcitrate synthase [Candidatus Limnocylindria bacterium]
MPRDTLTVTDDRTGRTYTLPIVDGAIRAADLAQIQLEPHGPGLVSYDPGLRNTALCRSKIGCIDAGPDRLTYRGYDIEELAARSTYLETAYLIVKGELPVASHFATWTRNIKMHTMLHENVKRLMEGFRYDARPMSILTGTVAALSAFYPDAHDVLDLESRRVQTRRLIGKMPTIAAFAYRRSRGLPYVYPDNELSYTGNFLSMLFKMTELEYRPNPVIERALDVLFILYAEHAQNCSTTAARITGSTHADPYSVIATALAAMSGPGHGGANERVLLMLQRIGTVDRVRDFVAELKANPPARVPGLGHSAYLQRDPRAPIIRTLAEEVYAEVGPPALLPVARELEKIVLHDHWFASRRLFPNADFYSALVYDAMGFPVEMFPVLFAIPRTASWMAQWAEMVVDPEQDVARPRQIYTGSAPRPYVPLEQRQQLGALETAIHGRL